MHAEGSAGAGVNLSCWSSAGYVFRFSMAWMQLMRADASRTGAAGTKLKSNQGESLLKLNRSINSLKARWQSARLAALLPPPVHMLSRVTPPAPMTNSPRLRRRRRSHPSSMCSFKMSFPTSTSRRAGCLSKTKGWYGNR